MQGIYYSLISIVAIIIFLVINFNFLKTKDSRPEYKAFKVYLVPVFIYYVTDTLWGIANAYHLTTFLYIDTVFYYLAMALSIVFWGDFANKYLQVDKRIAKIVNLFGFIFAIIEVTALIVNFFNPIFFSFDAAGTYHQGTARNIVFIIQIGLFANMSLQTITTLNQVKPENKRRSFAIFAFALTMVISLTAQTFFPLLPLYAIGLIVGNCFTHAFIFEDEKSNQLKTIKALNAEIQESYKQTEKALRVQKEYNRIVSNAGLGVWHISLKDGTKPRMQANPKMKELLGVADSEMSDEDLYNHWFSRIPKEEVENVNKAIEKILGGDFAEVTYKWNHPFNGVIYVRCGGTAETLPNGIIVLSGYHADVTNIIIQEMTQKEELLAAMKAADQANAAKTTFLNNMSHDIRTPMNAILGYSKLLENKYDEPETVKDYLGKIKSSGEYLLEIINNILDVSKIDSGKVAVDDGFIDLTDPSCNIAILLENEMSKRDLHFEQHMNIEHRYVYADMSKIRQIVMNLMSNAIKYTPNGGHIQLLFDELPCDEKGYSLYKCVISDDGIGMSEEFLKTIFDPFTRERNTTESKIVGTGLGMAIVKRLVDLLGGTIEVKSTLGKGTTFEVVLKHRIVENPKDFIKDSKATDNKTVSFEGKSILLAEDNDLNAEIAIEILTDVGFKVERAVDGVDCVDKLRNAKEGDFDLILMDIQMPKLNGYKATELIRKAPTKWRANIPIFAMTANAFEEDKQNAFKAGMNGHIAKPIDVNKLFETIATVFNK